MIYVYSYVCDVKLHTFQKILDIIMQSLYSGII